MAFPAMKAFRTTLAYLQRHAFDLLKALWLPAALLVALQAYAAPPFFNAFASMLGLGPNPDPAEAAAFLGEFAKWGAILSIGSAIIMPMMTVASLRHIVRGDEMKGFFYLQYGGDELRVLAAYILLSVMAMLISIVGGLAATALAFVFMLLGPAAKAAADGIGNLFVNVVVAWFRLRLSVLFPAAVATRTIGFGVSWEATKGNVGGLLGFWFLVGLLLIPVAALATLPFVGDFIPLFQHLMAAGSDEQAASAALIPILQQFAKTFSIENPQFVFFALALGLSSVVTTAITNVAAGAAWRFLTDHAAPPSETNASAMAA